MRWVQHKKKEITMIVKKWMSTPVITISATESFYTGIERMKRNGIDAMPVMEKGKIVGIVTDGDLKRSSASDATSLDIHELLYLISRIEIRQIMTLPVICVPEDYTVEETADILLENNISVCPVVDKSNDLVGIITKSDLFRVILALSGFSKRGVQMGFLLPDTPGSIKEVTDVIRICGGRLVSINTTYTDAPVGFRNVYIRAFNIPKDVFTRMIEQFKRDTNLLYYIDHRNQQREIMPFYNFSSIPAVKFLPSERAG